MDYDTHRHNNPVLPFWIRVFETVLTLAVESGERKLVSDVFYLADVRHTLVLSSLTIFSKLS